MTQTEEKELKEYRTLKKKWHRNGRNGGLARADKLSDKRRREIAVAAARARWND